MLQPSSFFAPVLAYPYVLLCSAPLVPLLPCPCLFSVFVSGLAGRHLWSRQLSRRSLSLIVFVSFHLGLQPRWLIMLQHRL